MKRLLSAVAALFAMAPLAFSQDVYAPWRSDWADKAQAAIPELRKETVRPLSLVRSVRDAAAFQGWRMEPAGNMEQYYGQSMKKAPVVIVDFGRHLTGYFTFRIRTTYRTQDAPIRIKFTFAEVPAELNTPLDPWKGDLSRAWMQDEVITLLSIDRDITLERRLSGRYMKIELLGAPNDFDFAMEDLFFTATTSAGEALPLPPGTSEIMSRIHAVSVETLKECMQTVYEDGPKRDRRLWIGDLYLESIANCYSFRNHGLTRRCLYLLASWRRKTAGCTPMFSRHRIRIRSTVPIPWTTA